MTTPILDFLRRYAGSGTLRAHMPGHKGRGPLGCEQYDITEIAGADDLSCPEGIIAESEANASALFGSRATLYSTGGSSQCVKAMLLLAARRSGSRKILAARNVHKSFIHGCALLGLEPVWLRGGAEASLCSCRVSADELRSKLESMDELPVCVYITSPDYLGARQDVAALASVSHDFGLPLLVDNAHGAYLRFLPGRAHPLELGADMCCDSAHKTLGVLTGGAYLHISRRSCRDFESDAREALGAFGSSSPSYLIMASLDAANARLSAGYGEEAERFCRICGELRARLRADGIPVADSDPWRVSVPAYELGYSGHELAARLRAGAVEPEFADPDWLVLMLTPALNQGELERIGAALSGLERRAPRSPLPPPEPDEVVITPRDALLAARESVPVSLCAGRVMASAAATCPPAVPIVIAGERISAANARLMASYGIEYVDVVK